MAPSRMSAQARRDLHELQAAIAAAERAYSDQVCTMAETLRRIGREEPDATVKDLQAASGQPVAFVRMALEGLQQMTLATGTTARRTR